MKPKASNPFFAAITKHTCRPLITSLVAAGITMAAMMPTKVEGAVLLSWDFAGNTGSETSVTAGVIDSALGSGSGVLTRGPGLTATTNADRFNASNWATGSISNAISGNDYFEFSLIYNGTNSITIDTMNFIWQRSGTGTSGLAIRSSLDTFGSNLATFSVVDNTSSQSFVTSDLGAAFTNITSNVTFRFYGFSEDAGGTGGFEGVGADLVVNGVMGASGTSYFWLGSDTNRGGSGTWSNTGGTAWSTTDADGTGAAWDGSKTATFNTAAASVTVDGTVDANNGINFATGSNGSTITGGDAIILGGATPAENTITTASGVTATIATNLTGSNGMTKAGAGTLVFIGEKSYSGETVISAGTLQLGDGVTNGRLIYQITNNASLVVNNNSLQTISNSISGTGSLTKLGTADLTLTGNNTYSGGTTVSAGTLIGDATSLQGAITNNAAIIFNEVATGTYAGNMTGSGSFTKIGVGDLTLSGTNSYSGGTTVSEGTLTGTSASLQGAIINNAAVVFDQSTAGTYSGNMTGTGSLTKTGAGNLTLTGSNAYSGGTSVDSGILTGTTTSLQGDITNNAAVVFDQATNGTYSGTITGTGTLSKTGNGSVTLSGNNEYQGGTSITGGTVVAASNTALGSGAVEVSGASLLASAGTTVGNAITVEAVTGPSQVVAYWNFNSLSIATASAPGSGGVPLTIAANQGSGTLSLENWTGLVDDFGGTTLNRLSGDPAEESLSLVSTSGSGNGSRIQISGLDLSNLINVQVSLATQRTTTGFNNNQWAYSADGASFTNFGSSINPSTSFAIVSAGTSGLDGESSGFLRYTLNGASGTSQNNRIDNLQITASSLILPTLGGNHTSGTAAFSGDITLDSSVQLTSASGGTVVFSGIIADGANGAQGITKIGAGTVELTGDNTYTGATLVNAGTLMVNNLSGSATGSGDVSIASGASLAGAGTISGSVTLDGIIAPGNSIGTLSTGSITWNGVISASAATNWQFELGEFDTSDLLSITGDFIKNTTNGGVFQFDFLNSTAEGTFELVTWTETTDFLASDFSYTGYAAANPGEFSIVGNSLYFTTVPEPSTVVASMLAGLGLLRRRRSA